MHKSDERLTQAPSANAVSDQDLLRDYAAHGSHGVFARLVERHAEWVYSAALRQTGHHAMAQDVTQAVFIILARKAASIRRETVLAGWLFRAVRYAALDARKIDARRQIREQEAAQMQLTDSLNDPGSDWEPLAPLLDEALATLGTKDRDAVLLRFFEKKSFNEIGATLGGNENSARVRVVRAVEKLRGFFRRHRVVVSAAVLNGVLLSNAVQAVPPGLASALVSGATTAGQSTAAGLVEAVLRRLRWRRVVRVGSATGLFLFLTVVTTLAIRQRQARQAAELAEAGRSVRDALVAIDRAFMLNDPTGFVALIHFRNPEEERFQPVLANYIRAESLFRREMRQKFNVQQRTFDATFHELCVEQPAVLTSYIASNRAATNVMIARYPFHLVKVGSAWKWDLFGGLSREVRDQRMAVLGRKAQRLEILARQVQEGVSTNVTEILQAFQSTAP